jgi:hypothetical protein
LEPFNACGPDTDQQDNNNACKSLEKHLASPFHARRLWQRALRGELGGVLRTSPLPLAVQSGSQAGLEDVHTQRLEAIGRFADELHVLLLCQE